MTTRPSDMPPSAGPRSSARAAGTPTMTCRVAWGANPSEDRGTATTTTSVRTGTAFTFVCPTAETLGATQTSTTDPCRTVAGRSSETTLIGTSTRAGPDPRARADLG